MSQPALRVVSVGECTIDHYLDLQQEYVGGINLNFAVHCKRSGAEKVSLLSRVGNDHGARILQKLGREGVDTSHVFVKPGATARQNILLRSRGERIFPPGGYSPGVLDGFFLQEDDLNFLLCHNLLASALFTQIEALLRQVVQTPEFQGWRVADFLDLSDYGKETGIVERFVDRLTIAFLSGDGELVERLRSLSRSTRCLFVVTLGAEGSVALVDGEPLYQAPVPVDNGIDTTGCGDAFQAAFTVSYWRNRDLRQALQSGAEQAAQVIQHYGAIGE